MNIGKIICWFKAKTARSPKYPKHIPREVIEQPLYRAVRQQYFVNKMDQGFMLGHSRMWLKATTGLLLLNLLFIACGYFLAFSLGLLVNLYTLTQFKVNKEFSDFDKAIKALEFDLTGSKT